MNKFRRSMWVVMYGIALLQGDGFCGVTDTRVPDEVIRDWYIFNPEPYEKGLIDAVCNDDVGSLWHCYLVGRSRELDWQDWYGKTLLHLAAMWGSARVAALLLKEFKLNKDACDSDGRTPLHYAVKAGHCGVVDVLLHWRARRDIADHDGNIPMDYLNGLRDAATRKRIVAMLAKKRKERSICRRIIGCIF